MKAVVTLMSEIVVNPLSEIPNVRDRTAVAVKVCTQSDAAR
jgi:hypothetical protein